ncbi:MAG: ribonuclease D [Gammaproteobacteria bacterium]
MPDFGEPDYINTAEQLVALCDKLQSQPWVAVDTEFLREKTYYPILCLIQIAAPDGTIACVDPIALDDYKPLLAIFFDKNITKVFHACSQDLEILLYDGDAVPSPIFDTQIAAPLLGFREQMGYAALVSEMSGHALEKAFSRTDWSKRPLTDQQIDYALDDVRYLSGIYLQMMATLSESGRLSWLDAEFSQYEDASRYTVNPDQAWLRMRGADRLKGPKLSVLQHLASWREKTAKQDDRPRNWILRDDVIMDIARQLPKDIPGLQNIRQFPEKTIQRHGKLLLSLVQEASQQQPVPGPVRPKTTKPTRNQDALADILLAQLTLLADKHQINPVMIATRKQLISLITGSTDLPVLKGWRYDIAGKELQAMLHGERSLSIRDGQLHIDAVSDTADH